MGRRLLIVDDDARVTELLSRYLASVGYLTSLLAGRRHGDRVDRRT